MKKFFTLLITIILSTYLCGCVDNRQEEIDALTEEINSVQEEKAALQKENTSLKEKLESLTNKEETPAPAKIPKEKENLSVLFNGSYIKTYATADEASAHPVLAEIVDTSETFLFTISGITLSKVIITGERIEIDNICYFSGYETLPIEHLGDNVYSVEHFTISAASDRTITLVSENGTTRYFYLDINRRI